MGIDRKCPQCGAALRADAPEGLCPACLMRLVAAPPDPATEPASHASEGPAEEGLRFGPYTTVRLLGEGGMGYVYLARQEQPIQRLAALKVIKPGLDSQQVTARFASERQSLSLMDHPNIARVFDAGTSDDGRPYFAMEYVPGVPLIEYCDARRLTTRERLEVFLQVCLAIHHAHQKGIIHRDIKPSNVLVEVQDGKAVPKVIDFGVAKAIRPTITPTTLFTEAGVLIGTPEYMSPEQAQLTPREVDTATDIYSLGVLLYELLVGTLPFEAQELRRAGYIEILRTIREEDPPCLTSRLKTLGGKAADIAIRRRTDTHSLEKQLRGELEWITMRAIEKEPARRYPSASELAADVKRHLEDEPVQASPPNALYRARKFLRKHRAGVTAIAAIILVSVAGAAISTALFFRAQNQKAVAQWQSYLANINAADAYINAGKLADAQQQLQKCEPSLRNWEWRYLWARSDTSLATLHGRARSIGFSRDGRQILVATRDRVKVWDASTFMLVATYSGLGTVLALSRDGTRVLTGDPPGGEPFKVRHPASGDTIVTLPGPNERGIAEFSPNGKVVAVNFMDSGLWVWDATNGNRLATFTGHTNPLAFSDDGSLLASGSSHGGMSVWDLRTRRPLASATAKKGIPRSAAFSPDGHQLAWGMRESIQVWELPSGRVRLDLPWNTSYGVMAIAFGPGNAELIVMGADGSVEIRDSVSGGHLGLLAGSTLGFTVAQGVVGISPKENQILVSNGIDSVKIWDYHKQVPHRIPFSAGGDSLGVSPDHIAVVTGGRLFVLEAGTRSPLPAWSGNPGYEKVLFTPDGVLLAAVAGGRQITVWNVATKAVVAQIADESGKVVSLAFSRDRRCLASVGQDGLARVWELKSGRSVGTVRLPKIKRAQFLKPEAPSRIALNSDGTRIGLAYYSMPSPYLELFQSSQRGASRLEVHEIDTGRVVVDVEVPELAEMNPGSSEMNLEFSPDGKWIAAGAYGQHRVSLLRAPTGGVVSTLTGTGYITGFHFTPDGARLATTTSDKTVTIWEPVGAQSLVLIRDCALQAIDTDRLACLNSNGDVRIWDGRSRYYPGARELVSTLLQRRFLVSEVIRDLKDDKANEEALRRAAVADARLRQDNLGGLWRWAIDTLATASLDKDDYQLAYDRIRAVGPVGIQEFQSLLSG